jgi:hypothetical protein
VESGASVLEAVEVMSERGVGAVGVVDNGMLRGIFTERDVMLRVVLRERDPKLTLVRDVMTAPPETVSEETTEEDALVHMVERHVRHLPIVAKDGSLQAMLSIRNLLEHRVDELARKHLRLDTGGRCREHSPLPRGEGGPRPALSPAGAGRVRGYFDGAAQLFAAVRSTVILCPCASQPPASANCGAAKRKLKKRLGICCAAENWVVDFYCFEHRLAIELDGGVHSQPSQMRTDATKEDYLRTLGIGLLRIPNGLVLEDAEEFVRKVREAIGLTTGQFEPS